MKPTVRILKNKVIVYRSRYPTKAEYKKNPEARTMEEVVAIRFSDIPPEITINRGLCE